MEELKLTFRGARVEAGLSLDEACESLGIKTRQRLIDIEKGRRAPDVATLERMAKLYRLNNWRAFKIPQYTR